MSDQQDTFGTDGPRYTPLSQVHSALQNLNKSQLQAAFAQVSPDKAPAISIAPPKPNVLTHLAGGAAAGAGIGFGVGGPIGAAIGGGIGAVAGVGLAALRGAARTATHTVK